jgi:hypothetical protein
MKEIFKKRFFTQFTTIQLYFIAGNFLLLFFLILLSNLGVLPIRNLGDFIFFAFLTLAFSLYRPGWAFLTFIGTIALENINLAPTNLGIAIRPYQFFGAIVILAILARLIAKRLSFSLEKPKWYDLLAILAAAGGFISALGSSNSALSFKLSVIFSSFVVLYFLIRNYVRDIEDLKKILPVFLGSSSVVVLYAIWQNMIFAGGLAAYEVMPGRPNSTFAEADWLGIFLVFLIAIIYSIIYFKQSSCVDIEKKDRWKEFLFPYTFLALTFVTLVISVSRAAWLGALIETIFFLFAVLSGLTFDLKNWQWKLFAVTLTRIFLTLVLALGVVYFFHLTSFQLFNRAQSTGSGLQKITISCTPGSEVPERVNTVEELGKFSCHHINIEEIGKEVSAGNIVKEIYRNDPNVGLRTMIYKRSWKEIKENPLIGIGWGSIGKILGTDERGASLNASNIFLEMWLGTGLLGFFAFLVLWIYILLRNISNFVKAKNPEEQAFAIFVVAAWFGLTVANLFNSGIMLGFFWLFLAISLINLQPNEDRN